MAMFGFGATYGDEDVSGGFTRRGVACIGYEPREAPSLHALLRHIKTGDVAYLKGYPVNQGLIIKAVGVVVEDKVKKCEDLGWGVSVRWVWTRGDRRLGQIKDKYNVHSFTLYEEYNPEIQKEVLRLLLRGNMGRRSRRS